MRLFRYLLRLRRALDAPGGGPFEYLVATMAVVAGGRIARLEFFELEDVEKALARLAELRPRVSD